VVDHGRDHLEFQLVEARRSDLESLEIGDRLLDQDRIVRPSTVDRVGFLDVDEKNLDVLAILRVDALQLTS
jgi:hypothetical protein